MKKVKLKDLCEINIGRTPSRSNPNLWGIGHSWVSISDLNKSKFVTKTKEEITAEALAKSGCKIVKKGTLLMSFKLSLGKVAIAGKDLYTNEAIAALPIKSESIRDDYLFWALKQLNFDKITDRAVKGKTLNKAKLQNLEIPLPPIEEQKRIAQILDRADEVIKKRERTIKLLDEFLKSTFLDMFGNPITNTKKWEVKRFGDAVDVLTDYHANGSYEVLKKNVKLYNEPNYAYMVRTTDLEKGNFIDDIKYIDEHAYNFLEKSKVYGGEIIINKIGSAGKVYLMPKLEKPVSLAMNQFLVRLKADYSTIFFYYFLSSEYGQQIISKKVQGAVTKTITKDAVRSLLLPFPPHNKQIKFETVYRSVENAKLKVNQSLEYSKTLFNSLTQKAFKGEL